MFQFSRKAAAGVLFALGMLTAQEAFAYRVLEGVGQPSGTTLHACKCNNGVFGIWWRPQPITNSQCWLACGPYGGMRSIDKKFTPMVRAEEN